MLDFWFSNDFLRHQAKRRRYSPEGQLNSEEKTSLQPRCDLGQVPENFRRFPTRVCLPDEHERERTAQNADRLTTKCAQK